MTLLSIDWSDLRSLNGSQNNAFEELCCQLAANEAPADSKFVRKGTPDAGVECYAILEDQTEWGWQAKYFSSVGNSQWSQLDRSVKTTIKKHPQLVKYTICLPIDRPEGREEGKESLFDKWQKRVEKWTNWANKAGLEIQFEYWGSYEILERLSREEHRGRFHFWFGKEFFSKSWFSERVKESLASAGPRYTPEIHVELPVAQIFDGLARTPAFFLRIKHQLRDIKSLYSYINLRNLGEELDRLAADLDDRSQQLFNTLFSLDKLLVEPVPWESVRDHATEVLEPANELRRELSERERQARGINKVTDDQSTAFASADFIQYSSMNTYEISRFMAGIREILSFSGDSQAELSNLPALLLTGNAGQGKTHLLCDIADKRVETGMPTILLMGQQFTDGEPWSQIMRLLGLPENLVRDDFLGALQAAAQANNSKALIMIDALNEGAGSRIWVDHLSAMLQTLGRYPWISLALSIRSTYEASVIPDELREDKLVRVEHTGFADHEYQATRTFFDHYGIEQPSVPLLIPEFQNPLFLKLLCTGLYEAGESKFPRGLLGITAVFSLFVDNINLKLSGADYCNFNPRRQVVRQAIDSLAELMADQQVNWLPIEVAEEAVEQVLPGRGFDKSLYRHLVSEGILLVDNHYLGENRWIEGVQFAYEKFSDHIIVIHLLDRYLDVDNPDEAFLSGQPLASVMEGEWRHDGLIEALCIQIPERTGKELFDVAPIAADSYSTARGFVESLVWRNPQAISEITTQHLNRIATLWPNETDQILDSLLTVATSPEHPYNAHFLHNRLMKDEMAERDAWWSIFLHYQYGAQNAVDRLVDWAWSPEHKDHIDDKAIRLCGVALGWFLTTSNRFLRDRATKALVNLFSQRIRVFVDVLEQFREVNDPYVSERLYAVAYGCALRSVDDDQIKELAQRVYERVFQDGHPPVHILLRDYARGAIEYALYRGIDLDIEVARIRPPYNSEWPEIPSESEIEKYKHEEWEEEKGDRGRAQSRLYYSIMGGDFARYVIGTNTSSSKWLTISIDEPQWMSPEEKVARFELSITELQKESWAALKAMCDRLKTLRQHITIVVIPRLMDSSEDNDKSPKEDSYQESDREELQILDQEIAEVKERFLRLLDSEQQNFFDEIFPFLVGMDSNDPPRFDLKLGQRWIVDKAFKLGWTLDRFGAFDSYVGPHGHRKPNKPERIGKKYQWIAYHEFLARLADNFRFREPYPIDPEQRQYDGPWQLSLRDIDPSSVLRTTGRGSSWRETVPNWWFPTQYENWDEANNSVDWMKSNTDLPDVQSIIDVMRPSDGSNWISLGGFYHWEQPVPPEEDRDKVTRREIWYILKSYLVRKNDCDEILNWAIKQDFRGDWMPKGHDLYRVNYGELFWSPAYIYNTYPNEGAAGWQRGFFGNETPKPVLPLVDVYHQESEGYDCSIDDSISISAPTLELVDVISLSWNGSEGKYHDQTGRLVAFDPAVDENGPHTLLFRRDLLQSFLYVNGYCIIWTVLGSKELIGGGLGHRDWEGRLEINGAYCLRDGQIEGKITPYFQEP